MRLIIFFSILFTQFFSHPTHNDDHLNYRSSKCFDIHTLIVANDGLKVGRNVRKKDMEFWDKLERKAMGYIEIEIKPINETVQTVYSAVNICSHDQYLKYLDIAETLFNEYIEDYIDLYGIDTITSNVHNLSHIVDDVRKFGNLSKIDSYIFENALYGLKLKLRTCNRPLEQIAKRISELDLVFRNPVEFSDNKSNIEYELKYSNVNTETNDNIFQQISLSSNSFLSSRKFGDKWFLTNNNEIFEFHFATKVNEKYFLNGSRIKKTSNFFSEPFSSSYLNIFSGKNEKFPPCHVEIERVKAKMLCLHHNDELVFIPLLHTM